MVPASRSNQPDPLELQSDLQRFTDDFTIHTGQALDEYAQQVGTEAGRVQALQLKLLSVSAATAIASGPNPNENLLDMIALVTLGRITIEERWIKTTNGAAFQPWLRATRLLETNIWAIAARVLKPAQINELRQAIDEWYHTNPDVRTAFYARPHEFAAMFSTSHQKEANVNSVFSLVGLDPMAGIDPAVREITRTRLFAERAMFTLQRMPFLLRLQTELLVNQVAQQPEVQQALASTSRLSDSADRISRSVESVSQTAAQLPERLVAERKAIVTALEQQEGKLRELAAAVDQPLVSAAKMSTSLNTAITNFDWLMKRFGVGEPSTSPTPDTNSAPFNILDYGTVAGQIESMAKELTILITSLNTSLDQSTPHVQRLSQQATAEVNQVIDRAFRLALLLIVVLLAGSVIAGVAYRLLVKQLTRA
jgi:hypothetical protein